jgi:hypothetical protein
MIYNAIRVEVNYSPRLSPAEQLLLSLPNRMRNLRPFMIGSLAPAANRMLKRHWDTKGAAFGHAWAPWAPSTLAARIRKGNAAKGILRDTDHLYKTLFRARATDNRLRVIRNGLRLQLNVGVPFAIFHQLGTSFMPERQVIPDPLPNSFIRQARHLLKQFLLTGRAINA